MMEDSPRMTIEVPHLPQGYAGTLWVPAPVQKFVDSLPFDSKIKLTMGLCSSEYYREDDGSLGPSGWIGCCGPQGTRGADGRIVEDTRLPYDRKVLMITITFTTTTEWVDAHRPAFEKLSTSPGARGRTYKVLSDVRPQYKSQTQKWGLYKKPVFDSIFPAMKAAGIVETELDLVHYMADESDYYNLDFVCFKPWTTDEGCVETHMREIPSLTENVDVTLSILAIDVERNADALKDILVSLK